MTTIPKTSYESNPELFYAAMDHTAKSLRNLFVNGFRDPMRGTFRVVLLGVKGDAPYLSKVAHLYRSYNTVAKRGEERGPPKGVCAYCLAGTRGFAYEDLSTDHPCWEPTIAVKLPWLRTPSFIRHCLHDRSDPASFFKSDIWHVVHLGFGRSWVASVIQLILPQLPCANLDEKWDYLTDKYLLWCRRNKKQAHVSKITPYLMSYNEAGGAMGNWHKGALTTNFFKWLVELLGEVCADAQNLLLECRVATYRMNEMFSLLYRSLAFLNENECTFVAQQGLAFLRCYAKMALVQFNQGKQYLFPLYPKLHIFHHLILEVKQNGDRIHFALNPLMMSCQMDEDIVGKTSRISRRVSIKQVARRSLERFLVASHAAYVKANLLA